MKITIEIPDNAVKVMVCMVDESGYESEPKTLPLSAIIEVVE